MLEQVALIASTAEAGTEATEEALDILVRAHTRLVFQISYSVLRNHHDAEDATQETFLRVMRYRRQLNDVRDIRAWLARIAWRVAAEHRRSAPLRDDAGLEASLEQLRSQAAGAEQVAIGAQMLELTERLIARLPSDLRDPLILSTIEDMTSGEIAAVLEIPEASVRTRIYRARRLLKEKLTSLLEGKAL